MTVMSHQAKRPSPTTITMIPTTAPDEEERCKDRQEPHGHRDDQLDSYPFLVHGRLSRIRIWPPRSCAS